MKQCIVNFQDEEILKKLKELGYYCHRVIPSYRVSEPISAHSDVLYCKIDDFTIIASDCQKENLRLLEANGYTVILCDDLQPGYRTECLLNFIVNNEYIICNLKTALDFPIYKRKIKVNQGYTKCSTICLNENAYITDDDSVYTALTANGLDCLKIEKGNIELEGYDYGFIGGASVKLNDREILFFGDIDNKKEKASIIEFLNKYNIEAIFIENKKLTDIGSALIL